MSSRESGVPTTLTAIAPRCVDRCQRPAGRSGRRARARTSTVVDARQMPARGMGTDSQHGLAFAAGARFGRAPASGDGGPLRRDGLGTLRARRRHRRARHRRDAGEAFEQAALALTAVIDRSRAASSRGTRVEIALRGARRRAAAGRLAQRADLRDGDARHAVRPLRRDDRRPRARRRRPGASRSTARGTSRRSRSRARPTRRCRWRAAPTAAGSRSASSTCDATRGGTAADGPAGSGLIQTPIADVRVAAAAGGRDARARRSSSPTRRSIRDMDDKVLRAGRQRRHAAGHRQGVATRCPTRTGATASRSAASPPSIPDEGGVVSAGGVGFDISCGVRTLLTGPDARRRRAA